MRGCHTSLYRLLRDIFLVDNYMPQPFYDRLRLYFAKVGEVLRGEADAAAIFPNMTDVGMSRERIYADFLRTHLPSSCNTLLGGFLFGLNGQESNQIDIIVTSAICPQFNFMNRDGSSKTFACVDGTLAVASLKSCLDSTQLFDALDNLASVPQKKPMTGRIAPFVEIDDYDDWPYKIIYAPRGATLETLMASLEKYYERHPEIPYTHKPNLIHVAGSYNIIRVPKGGGHTRKGKPLTECSFYADQDATDAFSLLIAVENIQERCVISQYIGFTFWELRNSLPL
jgi:hypothetical protein